MKQVEGPVDRITKRLARLVDADELEAVEDATIRAINMLEDIAPEDQTFARQSARDEFGSDELVIDANAQVIDNEDDGYWVEAWIFVPKDEVVK